MRKKRIILLAKNDICILAISVKLSCASLSVANVLLLCMPLWNKQFLVLEFKNIF
jgi:hypothetical protein